MNDQHNETDRIDAAAAAADSPDPSLTPDPAPPDETVRSTTAPGEPPAAGDSGTEAADQRGTSTPPPIWAPPTLETPAPQNGPLQAAQAPQQPGWPQPVGPQQPGWPTEGTQQPGWPQPGWQQPGWPPQAPPQPGWAQPGWPQQPGWPAQGAQQRGWPQVPSSWPPIAPSAQPWSAPSLPPPPPPPGMSQMPPSLVWPEQAPRRASALRTTLLAVIAAALIAFGAGVVVARSAMPGGAQPLQGFDVYNQALADIKQNYVNAKNVDDKTLVYGSIRGMVAALGDTGHSRFLTPDEYKQEQAALNNQTVGIGVVANEVDGVFTIMRVLPGSPADRAGIKAGDQIVAVDGTQVTAGNFAETINRIRGTAGTSVKLSILHDGSASPVDVTVTRELLNVPLVSWGMVPGTTIADISLSGFDNGGEGKPGASEQVWAAIDAATRRGATGIVFDLRGNPGGYVDQAVNVTSEFLPDGNVFVQVFADGTRKNVPVVADPSYHRTKLPVAVLVDNGSASAAEITAGALQDAGRAKVVGARTFGTGTVLDTFKLSDGSVLFLGTSKFLTRGGKEILNRGITPDKIVSLPLGASPVVPSDLSSMTQAQYDTSTDTQLRAAVALLS